MNPEVIPESSIKTLDDAIALIMMHCEDLRKRVQSPSQLISTIDDIERQALTIANELATVQTGVDKKE